jgi:hypothetical protein
MVGGNGLYGPGAGEAGAPDDGPAIESVVEAAPGRPSRRSRAHTPSALSLGSARGSAADTADVAIIKAELNQRRRQLGPQRLDGFERPQVEPALPRREAQATDAAAPA